MHGKNLVVPDGSFVEEFSRLASDLQVELPPSAKETSLSEEIRCSLQDAALAETNRRGKLVQALRRALRLIADVWVAATSASKELSVLDRYRPIVDADCGS